MVKNEKCRLLILKMVKNENVCSLSLKWLVVVWWCPAFGRITQSSFGECQLSVSQVRSSYSRFSGHQTTKHTRTRCQVTAPRFLPVRAESLRTLAPFSVFTLCHCTSLFACCLSVTAGLARAAEIHAAVL